MLRAVVYGGDCGSGRYFQFLAAMFILNVHTWVCCTVKYGWIEKEGNMSGSGKAYCVHVQSKGGVAKQSSILYIGGSQKSDLLDAVYCYFM